MRGIPESSIPQKPHIEKLNALLDHIDLTHIALKVDDFRHHYRVFNVIFHRLLKKMKQEDPYFNKYGSRAQCAGSHYNKLRIKKPNEFDMDIIIDLPVGINVNREQPEATDVYIEPQGSAYVQLRMGKQFQKLQNRDDWEVTQTVEQWVDEEYYILSNNFLDWFKSVVDKALNRFRKKGTGPAIIYVDGVGYKVRRATHGPAVTLCVDNWKRRFAMDVDIVPAFKFPEDRWPISRDFRAITHECRSAQGMWMVVPKPNKYASSDQLKERSFRLAMHDQEKTIMHDKQNMKPTIRLMKKLRDSMNLPQISSYYINTLFFWETMKVPPSFWRQNPATIFKHMVGRLHDALVNGVIPYFWNPEENLIEHVNDEFLDASARRLFDLLTILEDPKQYKSVAKFLLTRREFKEYSNYLASTD